MSFMTAGLRDILFLDIETVAHTADFNTLDERLKTQWSRKAGYLKRDTDQTDEDLYHERAGIYAEFGKIVCIAVGRFAQNETGEPVLKTKVYGGHDEKAVLTEFKAMLERLDPASAKLCAHNGKEFDFPYLCRRMLINQIALPPLLNIAGKKSWEIPHIDTMELWKFGDFKHYTSLDLLSAIFNIPTSKDGLDGSKVNHAYHHENDLENIKAYCLRDVVVLANLYLKLKCITLPGELVVQQAP
jgi:DNA polymerase elongation subunit (family B)